MLLHGNNLSLAGVELKMRLQKNPRGEISWHLSWTPFVSPPLKKILAVAPHFRCHCICNHPQVYLKPRTTPFSFSRSQTLNAIYRVILKKVLFGIFRTILVSKEEKNFTIKNKDKGLSLSKFSWYLVIVKIIKIRHSKGHISQTNHDLKNIFMQK